MTDVVARPELSAPRAPAYGAPAARQAAGVIRDRLGIGEPVAGIILGSGLGGLAHQLQHARSLAYAEIPGFPPATVEGHAGTVIAGTLAGREVVCLAGRFHLYEGHAATVAAFPARVLHALGVPVLVVSNAAGGVRRTFVPGDLMVIADQLNLMGRSPLVGPVEPGDRRFPDMSDPYDPALRRLLHDVALARGIPLVEGVYCGLLGPCYETPAEVRMLERLGADAVGMSTVPEVIVARALGLRVAGVSLITNAAAGYAGVPLSHAEVMEVGRRAAARFEGLVGGLVGAL
ncbi:MAG TPA: purine-nucleoside phosphorylase [Gemmatimonadaceae bacterium]|nr:purine-nucleoside phosphorylase [Gemmatimonadaceae bacterium]